MHSEPQLVAAIPVLAALEKTWGYREFAVLDNNGNLITFAQNTRA